MTGEQFSHADPEIADALQALSTSGGLLSEALLRIGAEHLETGSDNGTAWSAIETVGHMLDLEVAYGLRLRLLLSSDSPRFAAFNEEAIILAERWNAADLQTLFAAWSSLRAAHVALISRLDVDALGRGGVDEAIGPITVREMVLRLSVHDRSHLSRLGQLEEKIHRPLAS